VLRLHRRGRVAGPSAGEAPQPLVIAKRIELSGGRLDPTLVVEVEAHNPGERAVDVDLGLEFALDLMGGGGNPAASYERFDDVSGSLIRSAHDGWGDVDASDQLAFGNTDAGVRVEMRLDAAARITWYPVETVSNSEAGFERVYQGSSLLIRWPLRLGAGETLVHRATFAVTQHRDLSAEELQAPGSGREIVTDAEIPGVEEGVGQGVA
jgi:alpha-amylase